MAAIPQNAQRAMTVARDVGGEVGRDVLMAVKAALDAPELGQRTNFSPLMDSAFAQLGSYAPLPVSMQVKKRMRLDGQIRFALSATKAPIMAAPIHFECRSAEVRELLNEVFIKSGFVKNLLQMSLNALDFGAQAMEQLWELGENYEVSWDQPGTDGAVDVKTKRYPQIFLPRRFKDLDPERVTYVKDSDGDLSAVVFGSHTAPIATLEDVRKALAENRVNVLDPRKAFVFVPGQEYQQYRGTSRLDWAYDPWYWQKIIYLIALRWYERKSDPPYVCYAPLEAGLPGDDVDEDTGFDSTDTRQDGLVLGARALAKLRSSGGVTLPSTPYRDDEGRPSATRVWEIKELAVQDMHPAFIDFLDHLDKKKSRAVLAADIVLSRDRQAGTLGSTEAAMQTVIEIQNEILGAWLELFNRDVLLPFLRYNGLEKERARLTTTGVLKDNQKALMDFMLKIVEADMLAEQAWGRVFPQSMTQMVDRDALLRESGIPHRQVDPDAPMPKPVPMEPTQEAKDGKAKVSNGPKGKRGTGVGSTAALGIQMDAATADYQAAALAAGQDAESWIRETAASLEERETLSTYEKAAIALGLWYLLAAPRDVGGKRVPGDRTVNALVFEAGRVRSPEALAIALPQLEARAAAVEGQFVIHPSATSETLPRYRAALQQTMGTLPAATDRDALAATLRRAAERGSADALALLDRFGGSAVTVRALADEAIDAIVEDNLEGVLLNIENIAIRNAQLMLETLLMATRRRLGLVSQISQFRFNGRYTDLTLEAHVRAAYRRAAVEISRANDERHFIKIPTTGDEVGGEDFVVATDGYWSGRADVLGISEPHTTFGMHHGSTSYWYPVPNEKRVRTG